MKLTIPSIKTKALEVYKACLANPKIDDEITSEIYELFILRMTSYMKRHKTEEEVTPSFITQAVRFIIRDIRKGQFKTSSRESSIETLHQALDEEPHYLSLDSEMNHNEEKLLNFIKSNMNTKKSFQQQASLFIMYYTCYFSTTFLRRSAELLNIPLFKWEHTNRLIRHSVLNSYEQKIKKVRTDLTKCYYKLLEYQNKMNNELNHYIKHEHSLTLQYWTEKQMQLLRQQEHIQMTPTFRELATITESHENTISYSLKTFTALLHNRDTMFKQEKKAV